MKKEEIKNEGLKVEGEEESKSATARDIVWTAFQRATLLSLAKLVFVSVLSSCSGFATHKPHACLR